MRKAEFVEFMRREITEGDYGLVPPAMDEAIERIAARHEAEVELMRRGWVRWLIIEREWLFWLLIALVLLGAYLLGRS